jgi:hypothetical protein
VRHRVLADLEVVLVAPGRLAIVTEPGERHLGVRLKECQTQGLPGIPRAELLGYLREVAAALDELRASEDLFHLALSPRQLILRPVQVEGETVAEEIAMLDFGLAELFWVPSGVHPRDLNPRYAPIELIQGTANDTIDQYSLALIFQEMLVGQHPFRQLSPRQMVSPRLRGQPDCDLLPVHDRPILLKALHPDPTQRFGSCLELVAALEEAPISANAECRMMNDECQPGNDESGQDLSSNSAFIIPNSSFPRHALDQLIAMIAPSCEIRARGNLFYLLQPGRRIEHRCWARLLPGTARLKLGGFREQCGATQLARTENTFVYAIYSEAGFFERWLARKAGLEVVIRLKPSEDGIQTPLVVTLQPLDRIGSRAAELLDALGPDLLTRLQEYLQTTCGRAEQEHYPHQQAVVLRLLDGAGRENRPIEGRIRDLGRQGITVFVTGSLAGDWVEVELKGEGPWPELRVPGRVRSRQVVETGELEVEIDFEERPV